MNREKLIQVYREADKHQRAMIIYNFAGARNAALRQEIMYQLTGEKHPKVKCGIHAIENTLNGLIMEE